MEPIIRHGKKVQVQKAGDRDALIRKAAAVCQSWQENGYDTIAVVCRDRENAAKTAAELDKYITVQESDLEKAVFDKGIMVLPVEYTKGLEFDAVLILIPRWTNTRWRTGMPSCYMWRQPGPYTNFMCCIPETSPD